MKNWMHSIVYWLNQTDTISAVYFSKGKNFNQFRPANNASLIRHYYKPMEIPGANSNPLPLDLKQSD